MRARAVDGNGDAVDHRRLSENVVPDVAEPDVDVGERRMIVRRVEVALQAGLDEHVVGARRQRRRQDPAQRRRQQLAAGRSGAGDGRQIVVAGEAARVVGVERTERAQVGARRIERLLAGGIDALGADERRRARGRVQRQRRWWAIERLGRRDRFVIADGIIDGIDARFSAHHDVAVAVIAAVGPDRQHHLASSVRPAIAGFEARVAGTIGQPQRAGRARHIDGVDEISEVILHPHRQLQIGGRLEAHVETVGACRAGEAAREHQRDDEEPAHRLAVVYFTTKRAGRRCSTRARARSTARVTRTTGSTSARAAARSRSSLVMAAAMGGDSE